MSEEKKPDRMVSHANAMDFAEAVCRASGWPVYDEEEDLRRAREAWDAQEEKEETMDPNETLDDARENFEIACTTTDEEIKESAVSNMLDAFHALDEWLTRGGFLPASWDCLYLCDNCRHVREGISESKVFYSKPDALDYEASEYIEIKFYLTFAEGENWVANEHPPWWAASTVAQHLRKARTQP